VHHVRSTLTELVTSQKFGEDSDHWQWSYAAGHAPPFRQCHELSQLKYLHTLVIPYASLLGWKPNDRQVFDWHKILPAALRHVTFTDDLYENFMTDGWEDHSLMPIFSDLASWLATCTESNEAPKFKLRLLQTDTEFHEATRRALSRTFEEHGVLCTVEKLLRDRIDKSWVRFGRRGRGNNRGHGLWSRTSMEVEGEIRKEKQRYYVKSPCNAIPLHTPRLGLRGGARTLLWRNPHSSTT
jgi:hypothetical protein